jgi:hypothetical protein
VHFWDFGGREIMHQTHRYFLTRRSLYLIVLEDRREDDRSVYDWPKVIRSRGGESPVLVVINKCDAGAPHLRLDETGTRAAYPNVAGFVAVSCNEGSEERIAGLRQEIAGLVAGDPRLKHVRDPRPGCAWRVAGALCRSWLFRRRWQRLSKGSLVAGGFPSRAVLRRWRWSCCCCSCRRTSCGRSSVECSAWASS